MGDIIPFISRLVGRLDWSVHEKARLQQLADKLGQGDLDLEVVFGRSDQGEPWCAVTGPDQEVLVHIARIGGRFMVHHIAQDVLETGSTLWAAVEQALGEAWAEAPAPALADVVPLESRHTHILSALILAAVLIEAEAEPLVEAPPELPGPTLSPEAPPSEPLSMTDDEPAPTQSRAAHEEAAKPSSGATKLALLAQDQADAPAPIVPDQPPALPPGGPPAQPEPSDAAAAGAEAAATSDDPALPSLIGGDGDDALTGGQAAEILLGGAGDDTLSGGGAPLDAFDWLHGGAGDDRLALDAQVIAVGGAGADRFVLNVRPDGGAELVLGRVLDFTPSQGDALALEGRPGVVVTALPEADILDGTAPPPGFGHPGPLPGFRVGLDVDGDGQADGQVLLAGAEVSGFVAANLRSSAPPPPAVDAPADPSLFPTAPDDGLFLL